MQRSKEVEVASEGLRLFFILHVGPVAHLASVCLTPMMRTSPVCIGFSMLSSCLHVFHLTFLTS